MCGQEAGLNGKIHVGRGDLEEIKAIGPKIRMSEFFMYDSDPDKKAYYVKAPRKYLVFDKTT